MNPSSAPAQILVVDDEPDLRTLYQLSLRREGHQVHAAGSLAQARRQLEQHRFDLVITDMRLPDGLGLELLRQRPTPRDGARWIVITAYGSAENAVEALKCGAFDYLTKPVDLQHLRRVVGAALQASSPAGAPDAAEPEFAPEAGPQPDAGEQALARLVGASAAMRALRQSIVRVARDMAPSNAQIDRLDQPHELHGDFHQSDSHENRCHVWQP